MASKSLGSGLGVMALLLATLGGCQYGTEVCVCQRVRGIASCPLDVTPPPVAAGESHEIPRPEPSPAPVPAPPADPLSRGDALGQPPATSEIKTVAYAAAEGPVQTPEAIRDRDVSAKRTAEKPQTLDIPSAIPGSEAPPLRLPPLGPDTRATQRRSEIENLYGELNVVTPVVGPSPAPGNAPLTLAELQNIAVTHSPLIRQAASDVDAARGAMIQAGAYPNPHFGYQCDNINTGATAGYQGGNISQTIVTGGKLKLARAAAEVDVENAELALRRARYDLATQVRSNYLAVLVSLERIKVNNALKEFAERVYRTQISRVTAGQAAPYEPLQLRVLAAQAETQLIQSNHEYEASWRRLVATLSCPDMPPTALAGRLDGPVPQITYQAALDRILKTHTDLVTAQNAVVRARYQLRLAKITPSCPNIDTTTVIEHDFTTPPFGTTVNVQMGIPLPIFDTNRGNIISAEAAMVRASSEYDRARNSLMTSLADSFARYQTSSTTFLYYRNGILADQVRAYRGVYQRYQVDPNADFNDVVTSQQTLAATIATYIQLLGDQWQAVADIAGLLQIDDFFLMGQGEM
jgi:cobalt-zinc-cadmium efflux system outer membrane protein